MSFTIFKIRLKPFTTFICFQLVIHGSTAVATVNACGAMHAAMVKLTVATGQTKKTVPLREQTIVSVRNGN